jgi:hypothetical protein
MNDQLKLQFRYFRARSGIKPVNLPSGNVRLIARSLGSTRQVGSTHLSSGILTRQGNNHSRSAIGLQDSRTQQQEGVLTPVVEILRSLH